MNRISEKFVRLSHLQKLRRCEQVAAVCYRIGSRGIEFLLVQTRSGRWTFPKGGAEPGLTPAQAAALEAFEEAGVHGRIEETSFTRYAYGIGDIHAHLCEVFRLDPPREFGRNPTWFSGGKARQRLREGRKPDSAAEISRVVDRAIRRVQQQQSPVLRKRRPGGAPDELQKVQFETVAGQATGRAFAGHVRREVRQAGVINPAVNAFARRVLQRPKLLQLGAPQEAELSARKAKR